MTNGTDDREQRIGDPSQPAAGPSAASPGALTRVDGTGTAAGIPVDPGGRPASLAADAVASPAGRGTPRLRRLPLPRQVVVAIEGGHLAGLAGASGMDPCKVVEAASAALALGDLAPTDATWIRNHTDGCVECREEVEMAGVLDGVLSGLIANPVPLTATPVSLPVRRAPRSTRPSARRAARVWSIETPVGGLFLAASSTGICEVDFAATMDQPRLLARLNARGFVPELVPRPTGGDELSRMGDAFTAYLSGEQQSVDVPVDLAGITEFTRIVLGATAAIPYGSVATYGAIAASIGQPSASRAVGNALGRNPVPLVVPCHRIVRADLSAGGFVGGSAIKEQLLHLERGFAHAAV